MQLKKNENSKYTGTAYFSRKAANLGVLLEERAWCTKRNVKPQHFVIERIIDISLLEYEGFCMGLLEDYSFIEENKELMREDSDGIWHCLLIRAEPSDSENLSGVLVNSEGYSYARYAAALGDAEEETCFQ